MAIVEEDLERLRAAVVLSDIVQQYVALRRVGRNWVGLCPFHAERSGSFNVRDETGRYRCFGCGAAGDVFKFVQEIEHLEFVAAVEQLAGKVGIQPVSYTHLRAHETVLDIVCRLLLEKKKNKTDKHRSRVQQSRRNTTRPAYQRIDNTLHSS